MWITNTVEYKRGIRQKRLDHTERGLWQTYGALVFQGPMILFRQEIPNRFIPNQCRPFADKLALNSLSFKRHLKSKNEIISEKKKTVLTGSPTEPVSLSGRIVMISCWILVVIFNALYTGNLTASLATERIDLPFRLQTSQKRAV